MKDFSGTVYKYDQGGKLKQVEGYRDGILQAALDGSKKSTSTHNAKMPLPCGSGAGKFIYFRVTEHTDWYVSVLRNDFEYVGSTAGGIHVESEYVPCEEVLNPKQQYERHEHTPHGGYGPSTSAHPKEVIPTPAFKASRAGCIYDKLVSTKIFGKYLKKFDGKFPVAHLKFDLSKSLASNVNGLTSQTSSYVITIQINENTLASRSTLEIARTLMHEAIHAEMFRKVIEINKYQNIGDYPGVYYYYYTYKIPTWQHQQMAAHYTGIIGEALAEFDGYKQPLQYYKDVAWEGLIHDKDATGKTISTTAWNSLSTQEKNRTIANINHSKSGGKNCP